jgi:hypothetical protein
MAVGNKHHAARVPGSEFLLDEAQLAAALGMLARRAAPQSPIAHAQPASEPLGLLRNTALLNATGRLIPEFSEILEVVIDPKRRVSCVSNIAGEPQWKEHRFFNAKTSRGAFVGLEKRNGEYKFVRFPSAADAAAHVGSVFELPDIAAGSERDEIVLELPSYAALLAGADAVQATALRARLARAPVAKPVLTPELLQNELQKALVNPVTSWAAAAGHLLSAVKLDAAADQMTPGMAALQNAGLVRPVQRGSVFTDTGEQFANAFNRLVRIAGLTLDVLSDRKWVKAAHLSLFFCADGIVITSWMDLSSPTPNVHLLQASAANTRNKIRTLFEFEPSPVSVKPAARPRPQSAAQRGCPACDKAISNPNAQFCTACEAKLGFSDQPQPRTVKPSRHRTQRRVNSTDRCCPNPQCGKVVAADKKFCTSCGTRMPAER